MTSSAPRAHRRFVRTIVQRLSKVQIQDWDNLRTLEAMLNARCRINIQDKLPNVRIDRVEAFVDPGTQRLLVRIHRDGKTISLHDDPYEFPSATLLAKVVLFAQEK